MFPSFKLNNEQVQDNALEYLSTENVKVAIYLINGIKLSGYILSHDATVVLLGDQENSNNQIIYKHAISTIVPAKKIDL